MPHFGRKTPKLCDILTILCEFTTFLPNFHSLFHYFHPNSTQIVHFAIKFFASHNLDTQNHHQKIPPTNHHQKSLFAEAFTSGVLLAY